MNKLEELREHIFVKEAEEKAVEDFIKKIWKVFPASNMMKIPSLKAVIMRGSMDQDEVIQVLEEYFEMAEENLLKEEEAETEEENEEAEALKKSIKTNMDGFSQELVECRTKTLGDMTEIINERFDYIQEEMTRAEQRMDDGEF